MNDDINKLLPLIPLRDIVVYPGMVAPLFVGREKSVKALEEAMNADKAILLATQLEAGSDDPTFEDINKIGTMGKILQLLRLPDGTVKVLIEGGERIKLTSFNIEDGYIKSNFIKLKDEIKIEEIEEKALLRTAKEQFEAYSKINKKISSEVLNTINDIDSVSQMADTIATHLNIELEDKQKLLELIEAKLRLEKVLEYIENDLSVIKVEKKIRTRVKQSMEKTQKEYYLNEQMKAIQKELSEDNEDKDEIVEFEEKIKKVKLSKEAKLKANSELKKLKGMGPMSAESSVVRNYLDWLTSIPWKKYTKIKTDLEKAENVLNEDHYGLNKV